jgi:hypothetical protein
MNPEWGEVPAVGLCLTTTGAVVALVRPDPLRLIAVAQVSGHGAMWRPDRGSGPWPTAWRMLVRARWRLGLPRWCPVSVVCGPSLRDGYRNAADVVARSAEALARSGLVQAAVIEPGRVAEVRNAVNLRVEPRLAPVAVGEEYAMAVGAAIAMLLPGPGDAAVDGRAGDAAVDGRAGDAAVDGSAGGPAAGGVIRDKVGDGSAGPAIGGRDRGEWTDVDARATGWVVEHIGDAVEPAAVTAANAR